MAKDDREQNIQSGFIAGSVPGLNSDPWHNYRDGQDAFVATG